MATTAKTARKQSVMRVMTADRAEHAHEPKLASAIALRIEREVVDMGWPVGDSLGSEAALIQRFGVGRSVLREAVRLLERDGVARMKSGPGGGLIVTAPTADTVTRTLVLLLEFGGLNDLDLFDARRSVEIVCVELACQRITTEGIARLYSELAHELQAHDEFDHHRLHVAIAGETGNPILTVFVEVMARLAVDSSVDKQRGISAFPDLIECIHSDHEGLVEAIAAHDSELACRRMLRHLTSIRKWNEVTIPARAKKRKPKS